MMERKFTDDEIVKALKCICGSVLFCADCPYSKTFNQPMRCKEMCAKDALDLINRQKAEIERLKSDLHDCVREVSKSHEIDKNKAIIEFAERLKKEACYPYVESDMRIVTVDDIDNLVKEMTESDVE